MIAADAKVIQIDVEAAGDRTQPPRRPRCSRRREGHRAGAARRAEAATTPAPASGRPRLATDRRQTWATTPTRTPHRRVDRPADAVRSSSTRLLPADRAVAVDSGHFLGYPSMFLDVPDARSWLFANGFQAVGLGLGNAIGAAIADPDRPTVAAIGDGGAFMALAELETAARLQLQAARGDLRRRRVRRRGPPLRADGPRRLAGPVPRRRPRRRSPAPPARRRRPSAARRPRHRRANGWTNPHGPLVLDAKVNPTICAEWLEEAFRAG